jgi:predicted transcriptional regulator
MSTKPLTLKGVIDVEDENDGLLRQWRREKQQLEDEARALRSELENERAEREKLQRSIVILRRQLAPLHHSLRAVFGEIELAVGEEEFAPSTASGAPSQPRSATDSRWESYKRSFPGAGAEIIDALLAHGQIKMTHLAKLIKRDYSTVKKWVKQLKDAGAVIGEPGDGGIRLKQ